MFTNKYVIYKNFIQYVILFINISFNKLTPKTNSICRIKQYKLVSYYSTSRYTTSCLAHGSNLLPTLSVTHDKFRVFLSHFQRALTSLSNQSFQKDHINQSPLVMFCSWLYFFENKKLGLCRWHLKSKTVKTNNQFFKFISNQQTQ